MGVNIVMWCRPFGAAVLMASYDSEGPQLYLIEPGGTAHVRHPTPPPPPPLHVQELLWQSRF